MVTFFKKGTSLVIAVQSEKKLSEETISKLQWLFDGAKALKSTRLKGKFIGPRREMITPWSTNAVEITQNMGIEGIQRIEEYILTTDEVPTLDKMLQRLYDGLSSDIFKITHEPEKIIHIEDLESYNISEGLALSEEEIGYLRGLSERIGRPLTDSEVFGFSQVNSEHCRHKIFNGTFIIDGKEMPSSLFKLIKKTSQENPNSLVSAY